MTVAYHPGPGWSLYATNGEYTDWAYRAHGTIAFTTELTSGCCTPDSGFYYGFAFPDDSALVRVLKAPKRKVSRGTLRAISPFSGA